MQFKFLTNPETINIINNLIKGSDKVDLAVSYLKNSGYKLIKDEIFKLINKNVKIRLIIDLDLNLQITDIEPIKDIKNLGSNIELRIYQTNNNNFHPKLYIFYNKDKVSVIVGSSNITKGGLIDNVESNMYIELNKSDNLSKDIMDYFNILWGNSTVPTNEELLEYDKLKTERRKSERKIRKGLIYKKLRNVINTKIIEIKEREKEKYWLFPKRKFTQKGLKIFEKYEGQEWNTTRKKLIYELDSTASSVGTMKAEFEDFGFLKTEKNNKGELILSLTPIGLEYIKISKPYGLILEQCLKWQLPNPEQEQVGGIRVFPFILTLKAIKELGYLTNVEIALFLFKVESMRQDDFDVLISKIRDYRKLKTEDKKQKYGEAPERDIRYLSYITTFFVQSGLIQKEGNKLILDKKRLKEIDNILKEYKNKQVKDYSTEEYHTYMGSM